MHKGLKRNFQLMPGAQWLNQAWAKAGDKAKAHSELAQLLSTDANLAQQAEAMDLLKQPKNWVATAGRRCANWGSRYSRQASSRKRWRVGGAPCVSCGNRGRRAKVPGGA